MDFFRQTLHRCFFALPFPSPVNRTISALIAELRRHDEGAIRWTPPENLHLTLRFLGELEDAEFNRAEEFITSFPPGPRFSLRVQEIDAFPSRRKPSVLILAAEGSTPEDQNALFSLQQKTEEFARHLRLEPEGHPFHPHITLGRIRRERTLSSALRTALEGASPNNFGEIEAEITSLSLMESRLKPDGAEYREVASATLK